MRDATLPFPTGPCPAGIERFGGDIQRPYPVGIGLVAAFRALEPALVFPVSTGNVPAPGALLGGFLGVNVDHRHPGQRRLVLDKGRQFIDDSI